MLSFSIITCTWNSEPFIAQCVDSVACQTHPAVEHVLVDGGSTDGTLERLRGARQPSRVANDIRGGISNAMNEGVRIASGDVIAHLHGDDYYLNDRVLGSVAAEMERTGARWLFARIVSDVDGQRVPPNWAMPPYSRSVLLRGNIVAHPATFMRRDLFEQLGGFDTRLRYAMDYDMWLRASAVAAPAYLDEFVAAFRRHAGGASTANALAAFEEDHAVRLRYVVGLPQRSFHDLVHLWRRWRRFRRLAPP